MADQPERPDEDLTQRLQPPSLLRRRRRPGPRAAEPEPRPLSPEAAPAPDPAGSTPPAPVDPPPRADRSWLPRRRHRGATATDPEPTGAPADPTATETVPVTPAAEDPPTLVEQPQPVPEPEPAAAPADPTATGTVPVAPAAEDPPTLVEQPQPVPEPEPTADQRPLFADDEHAERPVTEAAVDLDSVEPPPEQAALRPRRTGPVINGYLGSALVGLVVGLVTVLLTAGALRACEAVQGTASCGRPGLFLLLAILVAVVLLGGLLLRLLRLPDPGSTSLLAVGLLAVIGLLFLLEVVYEWWMIIVVPLISLGTYLLSHWVTAALVEPASRLATSRDERELWPD